MQTDSAGCQMIQANHPWWVEGIFLCQEIGVEITHVNGIPVE